MAAVPKLQARQLRLEALVGTGSFAEVWRARGPEGRVVALKRMLPHVARNSSAVAAFERESLLLQRVDHKGIVGLVASGADEAGPYLVLEYVDGATLASLLGSPVPARIALRVVHDVLAALEAVHGLRDEHGHRLGLVHRDLSPANVLVSVAGEVKLADFGIARAHIGTLATTGVLAKGTLGYMSPEQARGEPLDARSDLFSVGALLHELLSGAAPYDESDPKLALARARAGDVNAFSQTMPAAHPALWDLVDRALSARPSDRFASAASMREELLLVAGLAAESEGDEPELATDEQLGQWAGGAPRRETPIGLVTGQLTGQHAARGNVRRRVAAAFGLLAMLVAAAALWRASSGAALAPPIAVSGAAAAPQAAAAACATAVAQAPPSPAISAAPVQSASPRATPRPDRSPAGAPSAAGEHGTVDIGSEPSFAYVSIDGKPVGSTPLFGYRLSAGQHVVVVRREGLGSKSFTLEVRPGQHVAKVVALP